MRFVIFLIIFIIIPTYVLAGYRIHKPRAMIVTVGGSAQQPEIWSNNTNTRAVWFLEETTTATRDNAEGTSGNDLAPQTTLPNDGTSGNFKQGYYSNDFDTTHYLACTDANCGGTSELDFTGVYTMGCWGYADTAGTNRRLWAKTPNNSITTGYYAQRTNSSNRLSCVNTNTTVNAATTSFSTGEWVHAVCNYTGSQVQPYINGTASGTITSVSAPANVNGDFRLGMRSDSTTAANAWDGRLDECFVVAASLSAGQICRIARCGFDGEYCLCDGGTASNYRSCASDLDCRTYSPKGTCDTDSGTCQGRMIGVCSGGSNAGEPCENNTGCSGGSCAECTPVACNDSGP